ncbi:MAG: hypothetical protein PHW92_12685 [Lutibacter sp.]|jgi:hypothetical protein|nr:hypothetical protein [Lutibacter sp.]
MITFIAVKINKHNFKFKNMKKLILLLSIFVIAMSMTSCGPSDKQIEQAIDECYPDYKISDVVILNKEKEGKEYVIKAEYTSERITPPKRTSPCTKDGPPVGTIGHGKKTFWISKKDGHWVVRQRM